jgi:uncharacterized damage-inducible protein DinB
MTIKTDEYPAYFAPYVQLAQSDRSLYEEMQTSFGEVLDYLLSISEEQKDYAYAEGKWTVGQVFQHMIDVELVMAHRAFRISRRDKIDLPGFDHNAWAQNADVKHKSLAQLIKELKTARTVTLMHFKDLDEVALSLKGSVSENAISIRGLGYIIIGHLKHHVNLFKENYFANA